MSRAGGGVGRGARRLRGDLPARRPPAPAAVSTDDVVARARADDGAARRPGTPAPSPGPRRPTLLLAHLACPLRLRRPPYGAGTGGADADLRDRRRAPRGAGAPARAGAGRAGADDGRAASRARGAGRGGAGGAAATGGGLDLRQPDAVRGPAATSRPIPGRSTPTGRCWRRRARTCCSCPRSATMYPEGDETVVETTRLARAVPRRGAAGAFPGRGDGGLQAPQHRRARTSRCSARRTTSSSP